MVVVVVVVMGFLMIQKKAKGSQPKPPLYPSPQTHTPKNILNKKI
jgi:hypothetical protein